MPLTSLYQSRGAKRLPDSGSQAFPPINDDQEALSTVESSLPQRLQEQCQDLCVFGARLDKAEDVSSPVSVMPTATTIIMSAKAFPFKKDPDQV